MALVAQERLSGVSEALGIPEAARGLYEAAKELREHPSARELAIPLDPMPWARAGFNKKTGQHFTEKTRRKRMGEIGLLWAASRQRSLGSVSLGIFFDFVFEHADSHFDSAGHLRPEYVGAFPPRQKGDLDNLEKLIADALNGTAYADDAQINEKHSFRRYGGPGERAHSLVVIWPI